MGEQLFESKKDIYDIVLLLIEETEKMNSKGKSFDIVSSTAKQLPFFCCPNLLVEKEYQKLIEMYIYCNETNTPAYPGSYGKQPYKWIQSFFVLKQAFAQLEKQQIKKANNG